MKPVQSVRSEKKARNVINNYTHNLALMLIDWNYILNESGWKCGVYVERKRVYFISIPCFTCCLRFSFSLSLFSLSCTIHFFLSPEPVPFWGGGNGMWNRIEMKSNISHKYTNLYIVIDMTIYRIRGTIAFLLLHSWFFFQYFWKWHANEYKSGLHSPCQLHFIKMISDTHGI